MGLYLNPKNEGFLESINSEIYVDKTELISFTNSRMGTKQKYICVSRPRRFGKSMAAEMLTSYYCRSCDSRELFQNFKIARDLSFKNHLNQHNVIAINMQRSLRYSGPIELLLGRLQESVVRELKEEFREKIEFTNGDLIDILEQIYMKLGDTFVFIIDEWDYVLRVKKFNLEAQTKYLDFLKDLFKDAPYVQLAYMTGILPIKKYGTHSALNMFKEFSMTEPNQLAGHIGFTESEVKALCEAYTMDFNEMKRWYDGYCLGGDLHIYNPKSVVEALTDQLFRNYWTNTETYEALKVYIDMDFDGLRETVFEMLGGCHCQINTRRFKNDMTTFSSKDDVLTLLVHLGYLTYDFDLKEVWIPNEEIQNEFLDAMESPKWSGVNETIAASHALLESTLQMDCDAVAKGLDAVHQEATSILQYNDENSLSCVISLAYYSAREEYWVIRELPTGKGFADIVFIPLKHSNKPAIIVELKWDKSVEGAIQQIKDKNYVRSLENYTGEILLVGINYDKESKTHQCIIEKHQKESSRLMSLF